MGKRIVSVKDADINSVTFSAIFNIGDTKIATPTSKALAIQQPRAEFDATEDQSFADFSIFSRQAVWTPRTVFINKRTFNHYNSINVNRVSVTGVSQSAIFQIGSLTKVTADSRIKHERLLTL